jgi:hypothetical protein
MNTGCIQGLFYAPKSSPQTQFLVNMSRSSRSQVAAAPLRLSPFHSALSQRVVCARAASLSPASSLAESSSALPRSRELPSGKYTVLGEAFEVRSGDVFLGKKRLSAS